MRNGYWVIRTYKAGRVVEKTKYWVAGEKPTRSKRKMKSDIKKQQHNGICAVRELARLLNANFKKGDILSVLIIQTRGMKKSQKQRGALMTSASFYFTERRSVSLNCLYAGFPACAVKEELCSSTAAQ